MEMTSKIYCFALIVILMIDFFIEVSSKYTKMKKKVFHLTLWGTMMLPGAIFVGNIIFLKSPLMSYIVSIIMLIAGFALLIASAFLNTHFSKKTNNADLNFLLDVVESMYQLQINHFDSIEKGNQTLTHYEGECLIEQKKQVMQYIEKIHNLGVHYYTYCENYEKENAKMYAFLISKEKQRLNQAGIVYNEKHEIINVERLYELIQ